MSRLRTIAPAAALGAACAIIVVRFVREQSAAVRWAGAVASGERPVSLLHARVDGARDLGSVA